MLNLDANELNLYIFNSLLQFISLLLTIKLFGKLFKDKINIIEIIIFITILYLFSNEIMHSQGIVYWHQSLFQVLFLAQLLFFINLDNKINCILFFVLTLIMPYLEWTGYISNLGFATVILFGNLIKYDKIYFVSMKNLILSILIIFLTILSFIIFSFHFTIVLSSSRDFFNTLYNRFLARNITNKVSFLLLLKGYWNSYNLLLIVITIMLAIVLVFRKSRNLLKHNIKEMFWIYFIFIVLLLENIIMKQHAISYSFDRLKGIFLLLQIWFSLKYVIDKSFNIKKIYKIIFAFSLFSISLVFLFKYSFLDNNYKWKVDYLDDNIKLSNYINENYDIDSSELGQSLAVRGYANTLFNRNIYEDVNEKRIQDISLINEKRYALMLISENKPWNLYKYSSCIVWDNISKESKIISVKDGNINIENYNFVTVANLTDENWTSGISKNSNTILFENSERNRALLQTAQSLKVNDSIITINNVKVIGSQWIHVNLNNNIEISNFQYPSLIEVIQ